MNAFFEFDERRPNAGRWGKTRPSTGSIAAAVLMPVRIGLGGPFAMESKEHKCANDRRSKSSTLNP